MMSDSDSKESACNAGDLSSIPGLGRSPGEGKGYSLQYSCLKNPHRQRSLVGYSPCGRQELDMTERLIPFTLTHTHKYPSSSPKHARMALLAVAMAA